MPNDVTTPFPLVYTLMSPFLGVSVRSLGDCGETVKVEADSSSASLQLRGK